MSEKERTDEQGIIGREEYAEACAVRMEAEVATYEERISKKLGAKVTLG